MDKVIMDTVIMDTVIMDTVILVCGSEFIRQTGQKISLTNLYENWNTN
jgi:hypothetical protein